MLSAVLKNVNSHSSYREHLHFAWLVCIVHIISLVHYIMTNFAAFFSAALLVNAVVTFRSSGLWKKCSGGSVSDMKESPAEQAKHSSLLKKYLPVYLLATMSDWLQGPYVYALYDAYKYSQHDIAILFVAGFGSSMVFGSFVGGMADSGGRRRFAILFSIIYAASCVTKRVYWMNAVLPCIVLLLI